MDAYNLIDAHYSSGQDRTGQFFTNLKTGNDVYQSNFLFAFPHAVFLEQQLCWACCISLLWSFASLLKTEGTF